MAQPLSRATIPSPPQALSPVLRERDARLDAIKAAVGRLGHDFNNSLVPILGFVTLIKEEVSADSVAREYADSIELAGRRTGEMIEILLLATRPQRRYSPKEIDFKTLLWEETALMEGEAAKPGLTVLKCELERVPIKADPTHFRKLIRALLQNAWQATASPEEVEVSLQSLTLLPAQAAGLGVAAGEFFRWEIKDRGIGMSPEVLEKACEPFFSTRGKRESLGLGLTIAHSVTRLHGGQIEIESAHEKGTTVRIWLPKGGTQK